MNFEDLAENVRLWAHEKGIFDKSNVSRQLEKTREEVEELIDANGALGRWACVVSNKEFHAARDNVRLELGDVLVTLVIAAEMLSMDLEECLEAAYNKISKRKGEMRNGVFVKQEDLPTTKEEDL